MPSGVGVSRTQPISNLAVAIRNPDPTLKTAARTPMGSSYGAEVYLYACWFGLMRYAAMQQIVTSHL